MSTDNLIVLAGSLVILAWVFWPYRRKKNKQSLFVFCPDCRAELCAQTDAFQSDDDRGIRYICQCCGYESWWNFDIIPGAIQMTGPSGKIMKQ